MRNHTDATVRFAMPSTNPEYGGATIYADSGKFSVYSPGFRHRGWLGDPVEFWEGDA